MALRIAFFLAGFLLLCGATVLFPSIDLLASAPFYQPQDGFFLAAAVPLRIARGAMPFLVAAIVIAGAALIVIGRQGRGWRAGVFLLLALAIGPGLVVNVVFKDHWGRARPAQIAAFGGTADFTPAFLPSDQCQTNCSFPAGDPANGFVLVAAGMLVAARRPRRIAIAGALGLGALIGLVRMAQGGHFLSDVLATGFLVYATTWLLHRWIIVGDGLGDLGSAIRHPPPALKRSLLLLAVAAAAIWVAIAWLDRPLAAYFAGAGPTLLGVFRVVTMFGVSTGYLVAAVLVASFFTWAAARGADAARRRRHALYAWRAAFVFAAVAGAGLAGDVLKPIFGRARPRLYLSDGIFGFTWHGARAAYWSFPSGHAITIVAFAAALVILRQKALVPCAIGALLVMASRIVLNQHYLSDVIAGAVLAGAATWAVHAAFCRLGIALRISDNP